MDTFTTLATGLGQGLAYGVAAIAMLIVGFAVIDALTPGELPDLIWRDRNVNATVVAGTGLFGIGIIVVTSILTSHDDFVKGIVDTIGYGLLGVMLFAVAFKLTDWFTPGDLGDTVVDSTFHPAAAITGVVNVVMGMAIAAAIS